MPEKDKRFNLILPDETHIELKKRCAEERTSMSEKVRELVDEYLGTPKKTVNAPAFKGMRTNPSDASVIADAVGLTDLLKGK